MYFQYISGITVLLAYISSHGMFDLLVKPILPWLQTPEPPGEQLSIAPVVLPGKRFHGIEK